MSYNLKFKINITALIEMKSWVDFYHYYLNGFSNLYSLLSDILEKSLSSSKKKKVNYELFSYSELKQLFILTVNIYKLAYILLFVNEK